MVFEEFAPFTRRVMDLLDDDDLARVQGLLLARPDAGKVIPKSGDCGNCAWRPKATASAALAGGCTTKIHLVAANARCALNLVLLPG